MPDWLDAFVNSDDWLLEEYDPERHAQDEIEREILVVQCKMKLQQRCDLLRAMNQSVS